MTDQVETWLAVAGFDGYYEVSNLGRVRGLDRVLTRSNGRPQTVRSRVLALTKHSSGHLHVNLSRGDGQVEKKKVHRLVLEAFVGPCPPGYECCHYDDDPSNNRLDNLRWGTRSENTLDKVRNGKHHNSQKTHCHRGHEYTVENTYMSQGKRSCRTCKRDRFAERRRAA